MKQGEFEVKVSVGNTLNMGDYSSLRFDIEVRERFKEDATYDQAFAQVRAQVFKELEIVKEEARRRF